MRNLPAGAKDVLARQSGVISRAQAVTQGVTEAQIRTRLSRGDWTRILPTVFRSTEHEICTAGHVHAAILWAGPKAHLSGATAAWWWQLTDTPPTTIEVTVPTDSGRRSRPGIRIIRRTLPWQDRQFCRAVPVTGLPLTALHGAVALGRAGPAMLDRALQRTVRYEAVRQAHYRNFGCYGSRMAGQLLQAAGDGAAATSERMLIAGLRQSRIAGWQVNKPFLVSGVTLSPDVSFERERIAIEVDGWAWHHTPERFQHDRQRQNALVNAGWLVLRFTWFDLTDRMPHVLAQIASALAQRS